MSLTTPAGCTAACVAFPLCKFVRSRRIFRQRRSRRGAPHGRFERPNCPRNDDRFTVRHPPPRSASANAVPLTAQRSRMAPHSQHRRPCTAPHATPFWLPATLLILAPAARGADTLCDPSTTNCRTQLLTLIQNERVGIDVGFWFMQDSRYMNEIIKRWQAGVPVRILIDPRANPGLSRQRSDDRRLPAGRHPAAQAQGERHPPLEDDDLRRPEHRGVRIRQLQPRRVRAVDAVLATTSRRPSSTPTIRTS